MWEIFEDDNKWIRNMAKTSEFCGDISVFLGRFWPLDPLDLSLTCRKIFSQAWTSRKMRGPTWKMPPAILQQEMTMRTEMERWHQGTMKIGELPGWLMLTFCFTFLSFSIYIWSTSLPFVSRSLWMSVAKLSLKSTAKWWIAWSKKPGLQPSQTET